MNQEIKAISSNKNCIRCSLKILCSDKRKTSKSFWTWKNIASLLMRARLFTLHVSAVTSKLGEKNPFNCVGMKNCYLFHSVACSQLILASFVKSVVWVLTLHSKSRRKLGEIWKAVHIVYQALLTVVVAAADRASFHKSPFSWNTKPKTMFNIRWYEKPHSPQTRK